MWPEKMPPSGRELGIAIVYILHTQLSSSDSDSLFRIFFQELCTGLPDLLFQGANSGPEKNKFYDKGPK